MKIGLVGSGAIAQGYAALLGAEGHEVALWSPRNSLGDAKEITVQTEGLLERSAQACVHHDPAELQAADVVIFALRSNGHSAAFDQVAPHLRADQQIIISSQSSMGGLYLSRRLAARGIAPLILCWATTVISGPLVNGRVQTRILRGEMDVATIPAHRVEEGVALSEALFNIRFAPVADLLAISLSNLNPPLHMANALLNFTRIEKGEDWGVYSGITKGVSAISTRLDDERLALAELLGVRVRTAREHFLKSTPGLLPDAPLHELAASIDAKRKGTAPGPRSTETRFITEDVPFGIAFISALGRALSVPTPVHDAGLVLCDAIYGQDFAAQNTLLHGLGLEDGAALFRRRAIEGWETAPR